MDVGSRSLIVTHAQSGYICSWTVHMSKDSLCDSAWLYAFMTAHKNWPTGLIPQWLPLRKFQKSPGVWSVRLFLDTEQQCVKLCGQLSLRAMCQEEQQSERSWTRCDAADGTEPGPLSQYLHKQAWSKGNGCLWDYFNMQDRLPELGFVSADFRLLLAPFCGNVSRVSSNQTTAAARLSCGGTLFNYTLCPVSLHHLRNNSFSKYGKDREQTASLQKAELFPAC